MAVGPWLQLLLCVGHCWAHTEVGVMRIHKFQCCTRHIEHTNDKNNINKNKNIFEKMSGM